MHFTYLPKRKYIALAMSFFCWSEMSMAQQTKENTQDLSKASQKGWLTNSERKDDGSIVMTYTIKQSKKSDEVKYEDYVFGSDLSAKGMQPGKEAKVEKPPRTVTTLAAYAGGGNSFNVNSQKLALQKETWTQEWNYKTQKYEWDSRLSKEKVNLKNADGKYDGYTELSTDDGVFIIASYQPDAKGAGEQFVAAFVDINLNVKETPVTTGGNYSLVYYGERANGNPFVIMAPKAKSPDTKQYVYAEFTTKAELVTRNNFAAPSPNMMVMDYREIDGNLYIVAGSTKSSDPYEEEFTDYANISNPAMGISRQVQKYTKDVYSVELTNFHFLKLKDGKLEFASTTPVKSFKDKVVTPPGQKKATTYEGKRLAIQTLTVTPGGEYLLAGQLMDRDIVKEELVTKYKDIVGLYFDTKGALKAQFAVEKVNDDSKSEVFDSQQSFIISADGKTAYWEILEVKGTKGYASFVDAYNGNDTWTANYFPRIAKITLGTGALSDFTVLGSKGKFLMYRNHAYFVDEKARTRYYLGHDEDYEKVWVGKYVFE
jgi:L,D-peptidoglycan transpeptidase YkuD (ErfK/YbiS/YcfS/YnhG family)